jgi:hypothetical protein
MTVLIRPSAARRMGERVGPIGVMIKQRLMGRSAAGVGSARCQLTLFGDHHQGFEQPQTRAEHMPMFEALARHGQLWRTEAEMRR